LNCFAGKTGESSNVQKTKKSNKWQNRKTVNEYITRVLKPYIDTIRAKENLDLSYEKQKRALLIWDHHWTHLDNSTLDALQKIDCDVLYIPKKATDYFSVLDVGLNRPFKASMKSQFNAYMTTMIAKQLQDGVLPCNINIKMKTSFIKPLTAKWIVSSWKNLNENITIENSWAKVHENIVSNILVTPLE